MEIDRKSGIPAATSIKTSYISEDIPLYFIARLKYVYKNLHVEMPAPAMVIILQFSFSFMYSITPSKLSSRRTFCCDCLLLSDESKSLNF